MILRPALHRIRDYGVRQAAQRRFRPILKPERKIVLVRPDHFGDLLMLVPALRAFQRDVTDHEIVLMTGTWNAEIAQHLAPELDLVTFDFPGFVRGAGPPTPNQEPYEALFDAAEQLREVAPQAIVLLRDDHWWGAWMAREAGIPLRFGYDHPQLRPFLTHSLRIEHQHYVRQNADLLSRVASVLSYKATDHEPGPLDWPVNQISRRQRDELLTRYGISEEPVIVHPGSGANVKLWPEQRWSAVIDQLAADTSAPILLTGSPLEQSQCDEIRRYASSPAINLAGETSLFTLAELMRGAKLVLGVDSGPMHLATSVGTPSIHLYGPSDSLRYGPWGDPERHRLISAGMSCPSCGDLSAERDAGCGCMTAIGVNKVADAAIEMLAHE